MLILKRRLDQSVAIGADIVVKVVGIHDGLVILGITAPPATKINRDTEPESSSEPKPQD